MRHAPNWKENHSSKVIASLEKGIFPWIGVRFVTEITAPTLLATIRRIEARGVLEMAHGALACCGQVFGYIPTQIKGGKRLPPRQTYSGNGYQFSHATIASIGQLKLQASLQMRPDAYATACHLPARYRWNGVDAAANIFLTGSLNSET